MELQANLPTFEASGILPFAISYDAQSTLAAFAAARGITYPLLADEGSVFIRQLGILNTSLAPDDEHYGVARPGTYFVDEAGRVTEKVFYETYRTRNAATTVLRESLGLALSGNGPRDVQETDALVAVAAMDAGTFVRGERIGLTVTIQMAPGTHIYGPSIFGGYVPTTLDIAVPETVIADPVRYPEPHTLRMAWTDEVLPVYDGTFTLATALTFAEQREDVTITATLRFQVCTNDECYIPQRLSFTLPMTFMPFA